ncbi:MAG: exopolysaccharide Pel transporter PelG [Alphaproteobacteria bacterium]
MAGIGFTLRKLTKQGTLLGHSSAYLHAAMAAAGTWILTVAALGIVIATGIGTNQEVTHNFIIIITYNFAFSMILSAPLMLIMTRAVSDLFYLKSSRYIPGIFLGGLVMMYAIQIPFVICFYFFFFDLPFALSMSAAINFMLISHLWIISVFLGVLKDYKTITAAFFFGMIMVALTSNALGDIAQEAGMVHGFNLGLSLALAILLARFLFEYSFSFQRPFLFVRYFKNYWFLALVGLVQNISLWIDKWIMWLAPEAEISSLHLYSYIPYERALFLAYFITLIPVLSYFLLIFETRFFESFYNFYTSINKHATYDKIERNKETVVTQAVNGMKNIAVLQAIICLMSLALAPYILRLLHIPLSEVSMFRFGIVGASFYAFLLLLIILLHYFNKHGEALRINAFFLLSNALGTYFFMKAGFAYYGVGYCLAAILSFAYAITRVNYHLAHLSHYFFIDACYAPLSPFEEEGLI